VLGKMTKNKVKRTSTEAVTGEPPIGLQEAASEFPRSLGPLALATVNPRNLHIELKDASYSVKRAPNKNFIGEHGPIGPPAKLPKNWPGAPAGAINFCWAYPLEGSKGTAGGFLAEHKESFLSISTSPALQFVAYGGFVLLDKDRHVLAIQAISPESTDNIIPFDPPRKWRVGFTSQLKEKNRFQPITLPFMLKAGAQEFCWLNPQETFTLSPESWTPSIEGAFLYLMKNGDQMYFPAMLSGVSVRQDL